VPRKGAVHAGADADLLVVDMAREWTIERDWLHSRHKHSPFIGRRMQGWIDHVVVRGRAVARDALVVAEGGGTWVSA
jgi:dihydroorotase-like cyclic amidohydrolase